MRMCGKLVCAEELKPATYKGSLLDPDLLTAFMRAHRRTIAHLEQLSINLIDEARLSQNGGQCNVAKIDCKNFSR
jgi:hypothetical protein